MTDLVAEPLESAIPLSCPRCGDQHPIIKCPYVKAVQLAADGVTVVRVEFLTPADYVRQPAAEAPERENYPRMGPKA